MKALLLKFLASGIAVLYLYPVFHNLGSISYYLSNFDHFAKQLCINKDKPQMHCNGTCALSKMLIKQSHKDSNSEPVTGSSLPLLIFGFYSKPINIPTAQRLSHPIYSCFPVNYTSPFSAMWLHPPENDLPAFFNSSIT